jgi:beta-glucanase (GH16 family)
MARRLKRRSGRIAGRLQIKIVEVGMRILIALLLGVVMIAPDSSFAATTQPSGDYQLVWADEFNTDGPLNPADWQFESGFARNLELQWYQPDNAICKDGMLIIEARREQKPNPRFDATRPLPATQPSTNDRNWRNRKTIEYTAASANTRGKHSWLYGRFEIRAKIDVRQGSWPAFWMLGDSGPWPANGEVDIMEYYDNTVLANIAWAGDRNARGGTWNAKHIPLNTLAKNFENEFHTWRMDWTADDMTLYLDDAVVNRQDLSKTINAKPLPRGASENPFHTPMYILLNQAIGGTRGGDPSKTEFPIRYLIDFVRVWQTPDQQAATKAALQGKN